MTQRTPRTPPSKNINKSSFEKFLALFSSDPQRAMAAHENLRRKLMKFFEWRGDRSPEERTDETIHRISRRLDEGEMIRNISTYAYGVARLLGMEALTRSEQNDAPLGTPPPLEKLGDDRLANWSRCLDSCSKQLEPRVRDLLREYHRGDGSAKIENRKALAERLAITAEGLRIQTHRARVKLEACGRDCMEKAEEGNVIASRLTQ